jgi:hypothetical protein
MSSNGAVGKNGGLVLQRANAESQFSRNVKSVSAPANIYLRTPSAALTCEVWLTLPKYLSTDSALPSLHGSSVQNKTTQKLCLITENHKRPLAARRH